MPNTIDGQYILYVLLIFSFLSDIFQENDRRECLGLPEKSETGRIANCCGIIAISYVVENKELCKNKNQVILLKPFKK